MIGEFFKGLFDLIFKIIAILIPFVLIGGGVYCSVVLYKAETARSMTLGQIEEHDVWEDFNIYDCDLSDAIFYQTSNGYEFSESIPQSVSFNGNINKYNVLINDLPASYETSTAGRLMATYDINYYSVDGNNFLQMQLELNLTFYQSEIEIRITTTNTTQEQAYFLEYMRFNGLHLRIIEAQYTVATPSTTSYVITFVEADKTIISSTRYEENSIIAIPTPKDFDNLEFVRWEPEVSRLATSNVTYTAVYEPVNKVTYNVTMKGLNAFLTTDADFVNKWSSVYQIKINGTLYASFVDKTYFYEFDNKFVTFSLSDSYYSATQAMLFSMYLVGGASEGEPLRKSILTELRFYDSGAGYETLKAVAFWYWNNETSAYDQLTITSDTQLTLTFYY